MKRIFCLCLLLAAVPVRAVKTVFVPSRSPLVHVKVMIKAGSAMDPVGFEGLATMTGVLMTTGGFGDPAHPVTKEVLAELTRPWGGGAYPGVSVSKETTVISATVPREVLGSYVDQVLAPLLTRPLFDPKELERVRNETLQGLRSGLRFEEIEELGLVALDNDLHEGTSYAHPDFGTEKGLLGLKPEDLKRFYRTYFRPENMILGATTDDKTVLAKLEKALAKIGQGEGGTFAPTTPAAPPAVKGRRLLVVSLPNAISSGIHAGYPLPLTRKDADFWPLYVANAWFGTHRDSFSHLYQAIREQRGYNYGDYSYVEHFEGRPGNLFPPFNYPRRYQDFSIWLRPVAHAYVPHLLRAMSWELESFVKNGLSEEECALSKNKAKVLYLSLAETADRWLASRLDDEFYGMKPGYLDGYLSRVDAVTCAQANAAVRKYLQAKDMKYLVVTNAAEASKIADQAVSEGPVWGKGPADYQIEVKEEDGKKLYLVPEPKLDVLRQDAVWANSPLGLAKDAVRVVPAEKMFETAALPR